MKIRLNPFLAASIICMPLAGPSVHGATVNKDAAGTDLSAAASWTGGVAPTSADKAAWINTSITGALTVSSPVNWAQLEFTSTLAADTTLSGSDITLSSIATEGSGSSTYPLLNSANRLVTINNNILFNSDGRRHTISSNAGTLTLAGNISANGSLWLRGSSANSVASGNISGVTQLTKVDPGTWALTQANTIGSVKISAGGFLLGNDGALGSGTMTIDNGTTAASATLGVVTGTGARTLTNNFTIGGLTGNTLAVNTANGNITLNGNITEGTTYTGMKLTKSGANTLTLAGSGSNFSGGTTVTTTSDVVGLIVGHNNALGTGSVLLNGGNTFAGTLSLNSGITLANSITLKPSTNRAVIAMGDSSSLTTGTLIVDGSASSNQAVITSGAISAGTVVTVSQNISHTGANANQLSLRGGNSFGKVSGNISYGSGTIAILDSASWELSGANTYGILNINNAGATVYCGAANTLSSSGVVQDGSVSGTLKLSNLAGTTAFDQTIAALNQTVKVTTSVGTPTLTLSKDSGSYTSSGAISGSVSLTKAGGFTQTLTSINTYTGSTTIKAGTLKLETAGSIDNSTIITVGDAGSSVAVLDVTAKTTAFTVGTAQTLGGIGKLDATGKNVIVNGNLAPGNSAGLLSVSTVNAADGLAFGSTGALNLEMTRGVAPSAGTNYDQLGLTGGLTIAPGADLNLTALGSGSWMQNDIYFLIANDGADAITGTFSGIAEGSTVTFDSQQFKATYLADSIGNSFSGGNDFALRVVPEPSVILLGVMGSLALLRRRRA